jgi:hypothetical protein
MDRMMVCACPLLASPRWRFLQFEVSIIVRDLGTIGAGASHPTNRYGAILLTSVSSIDTLIFYRRASCNNLSEVACTKVTTDNLDREPYSIRSSVQVNTPEMSENVTWPPSLGLTTKIVTRKDAILQLSYSTIVRAPAPLVFDALLHVAEYPAWNSWVPAARILSQPTVVESGYDPNDLSRMRIGSVMTFDVLMDAQKPNKISHTPLRVVDICTPSEPTAYIPPAMLEDPTFTADLNKVYRVSWTGHGALHTLGMSLERFHEVIIVGENECEVRTWEVMSGPLARVVKLMYLNTLKEKLGLWCEDLKKRSEELSGMKTHG